MSETPSKRPCSFFQRGNCRYGEECRYAHVLIPSTSSVSSLTLPSSRKPCTVDEEKRSKAAMIIDGAWLVRSHLVENGTQLRIMDFGKIMDEAETYLPIRIDKRYSSFFNCDADEFFHKVLKGDMDKIRIRDGMSHFHKDIQRNMIRFVPSKFKSKTVECPRDKHKFIIQVQKGTDVQISTEIIRKADTEDVKAILLIAGDGDFETALQYAYEKFHKPIYIVGYQKHISPDIMQYCEDVLFLRPMPLLAPEHGLPTSSSDNNAEGNQTDYESPPDLLSLSISSPNKEKKSESSFPALSGRNDNLDDLIDLFSGRTR